MANNSNLTKRELVQDLSLPDVGTKKHEQYKAEIIVKCTEDLEKSIESLKEAIETFSTKSSELGSRVFYLNIILTAATVLYTIVSIMQYINRIPVRI